MSEAELITDAPLLRIYVAPHCVSCEEARRMAEAVRQKFAEITVEVIDLGDAASRNWDDVFSVPTYVLNGKVVSLGNPALAELELLVKAATLLEESMNDVEAT